MQLVNSSISANNQSLALGNDTTAVTQTYQYIQQNRNSNNSSNFEQVAIQITDVKAISTGNDTLTNTLSEQEIIQNLFNNNDTANINQTSEQISIITTTAQQNNFLNNLPLFPENANNQTNLTLTNFSHLPIQNESLLETITLAKNNAQSTIQANLLSNLTDHNLVINSSSNSYLKGKQQNFESLAETQLTNFNFFRVETNQPFYFDFELTLNIGNSFEHQLGSTENFSYLFLGLFDSKSPTISEGLEIFVNLPLNNELSTSNSTFISWGKTNNLEINNLELDYNLEANKTSYIDLNLSGELELFLTEATEISLWTITTNKVCFQAQITANPCQIPSVNEPSSIISLLIFAIFTLLFFKKLLQPN